jgi:hypothetical protein
MVEKVRVRWFWIVGCLLGGSALVSASFALEAWWNWQGVTPSVLVNVGTSLGLAGLLFLLERRFTAHLIEANATAVRSAVQSATEDFATRLDQLRADMEQRSADVSDRRAEVLRRLDEAVSFERLTRAFTEANTAGSILGGSVTVPGGAASGEVRVTFSWGAGTGREPRLVIDAGDDANTAQTMEWPESASAAAVGQALHDRLRRAAPDRESPVLDWISTLDHLRMALRMALRPGNAPRGRVTELLDSRWVITDAGLECPSAGYLLGHEAFPDRVGTGVPAGPSSWPPSRPACAGNDDWGLLVDRAERVLPLTRSRRNGRSAWSPWVSPDMPTSPRDD